MEALVSVDDEATETLLRQLESIAPQSRLTDNQRQELLDQLPRLTEDDIVLKGYKDSSCSICLTPYLALLAEEEIACAMDSPAHHLDDLGVTQLSRVGQCGHIFCRKDISKWIRDSHDDCPLCRRPFLPNETSSRSESQANPPSMNRTVADSDPYQLLLYHSLSSRIQPRIVRDDHQDDRHQFSSMYS